MIEGVAIEGGADSLLPSTLARLGFALYSLILITVMLLVAGLTDGSRTRTRSGDKRDGYGTRGRNWTTGGQTHRTSILRPAH